MRLRYLAIILLISIVLLVSGCTGATINPTSTPAVTTPHPTLYPTPTSTPKPVEVGFSRLNPAPVGTPVDFTSTATDGTVTNVEMTVEQIIRGKDAWNMIYKENSFNSKAPEGTEYMLAKFKVTTSGGDPSQSFSLSSMVLFHAISSSGTPMDYQFVVNPKPSLPESVYPGGTTEGWRAFIVNVDDKAPLLMYGSTIADQNIWFATK